MTNLKHLKDDIECLDTHQQVHIGKLFYDNNINMFENKNGVFINLTEINEDILDKIRIYLKHVKEQEKSIKDVEIKKQEYKDNFFTNVNEICE